MGFILTLAGCGGSSTTTVEPPTPTEPELDLVYPLPTDGADALMDFINTMAAREPVGDDDEARTKDIGHMMESRVAAAEKLLTLPEGKQYAGMTARTKLESLRVLQMIGQPGAETTFSEYAAEISKSDNDEVAAVGQIGLFQSMIDSTMNQQTDGSAAVDSFKELVTNIGKTEPVFFAGQEAALMLKQSGNLNGAVGLLTALSESFSTHENEEVASEARAAGKETKLLAFDAKFRELLTDDSNVGDELTAMAHELLSTDTINPTALGMIMQAAQQLEYSGRVENAGELYSKAETATQETEFATQIGPELASAKKRLALIGEPFEVTGQVIGGKEIDWSSYKDKVVLVDFWATWCGPCLREVPNIKKNFVRFQELGFEVVGINLDDDLATVEKFLADNPLPWDTVVGESDSEFGFDNPNAKRCGVQAIPFLVLVGKDGNVAALHVRDKLLDEKLIELLGEPEEEVLEIADPNDDDAE